MVSLPSTSLILALLILVPGFLSYKVARRIGKVTTQVDRFDKTIFTIIGSGVSFSFLVIMYSYYYTERISVVVSRGYNIVEASLAYLLLLGIALLVGGIVGLVIDRGVNRGEDIRSESTWQIISEEKEEPAEVQAVMNNGDEIWGEIKITDSEPHGQDLLLEYPQIITREEDREIVGKENAGKYVFLSQTDISHVFINTDINE